MTSAVAVFWSSLYMVRSSVCRVPVVWHTQDNPSSTAPQFCLRIPLIDDDHDLTLAALSLIFSVLCHRHLSFNLATNLRIEQRYSASSPLSLLPSRAVYCLPCETYRLFGSATGPCVPFFKKSYPPRSMQSSHLLPSLISSPRIHSRALLCSLR